MTETSGVRKIEWKRTGPVCQFMPGTLHALFSLTFITAIDEETGPRGGQGAGQKPRSQ